MITGLDRSTSGEIWVAGAPIHRFGPEKAARWRGGTLGVVFQTFELLPTLTVLQNVMLPMDFAHRYPHGEQRRRAMHLLEQVEIAEHAKQAAGRAIRRPAAAAVHRPRHGQRPAHPGRR